MMIQPIRDLARQCFRQHHSTCVTLRAQHMIPSQEVLLSRITPLTQTRALDPHEQGMFQKLLQTGTEIYLYFALQGKVFVGIDDRTGVLCLGCAGTLQGPDAIPDLFVYCQSYAVFDTDPVAACLNCEICSDPLIPPGYPGGNPR